MIAIVPGHTHLTHDEDTGRLQTWDEITDEFEICINANQWHTHPAAIDAVIICETVELRAEGSGLYQLQAGTTYVLFEIESLGDHPVLGHAVEPGHGLSQVM